MSERDRDLRVTLRSRSRLFLLRKDGRRGRRGGQAVEFPVRLRELLFDEGDLREGDPDMGDRGLGGAGRDGERRLAQDPEHGFGVDPAHPMPFGIAATVEARTGRALAGVGARRRSARNQALERSFPASQDFGQWRRNCWRARVAHRVLSWVRRLVIGDHARSPTISGASVSRCRNA